MYRIYYSDFQIGRDEFFFDKLRKFVIRRENSADRVFFSLNQPLRHFYFY